MLAILFIVSLFIVIYKLEIYNAEEDISNSVNDNAAETSEKGQDVDDCGEII